MHRDSSCVFPRFACYLLLLIQTTIEQRYSQPKQITAGLRSIRIAGRRRVSIFEMLAWEGRNIAFLTKKGDYDVAEMTAFVKRLDDGWQTYSELIGRQPRRMKIFDDKPVICAIPQIESVLRIRLWLCGRHRDRSFCVLPRWTCPISKSIQAAFSTTTSMKWDETFFVFGDRHSLFTTGYAVFMREWSAWIDLNAKDLDARTRRTIEDCEGDLRKVGH